MYSIVRRLCSVQAVGELDQDHAQVLRHREHELAVVLCLRVLAALELNARQLGHTLDEAGDLLAELRPDVVDLDPGVLDRVVQKRGGESCLVEAELGEDLRRAPRVIDELLPRPPELALVRPRREVERPRQ
jgi:hypothetical protein